MESEKAKKHINKKRIVVIAAVVLAAVFAVAAASAAKTLGSKQIYEGVSVSGVDLGSMSEDEAKKALESYFNSHSEFALLFKCDGEEFEVQTQEISLKADISRAIKAAYGAGRGHGVFKNYMDIISYKRNGYSVPLEITYDKDLLLTLINDKISDKITDCAPMNVEIGTDRLYITNAAAGKGVSSEKLFNETDKRLKKLSAGSVIELSIETIKPENPTFEEFAGEYLREPKDAVYTKTDDGYIIEPEVVGISFDKQDAKKIFEENRDTADVYEIPAVITVPEVTSKMLEDKYVNKIIASYTTSFSGSSSNRCANISLAAQKIDGYVINPGKRFSYNAVVGPRTAAAGFKTAHVYVGTQVVDGIGGGICQVSSTLYNAAILADMKIVSRTNHSIPVGYVPLGRDATVSYGSIDFVFENDKSYPVSVKASVSGTNITVSIVGTQNSDYTVEIVTEPAKTIAYSTATVDDPTLPEGQTKVIAKGSNGSVVNSYRVYKRNGAEYSRKFEAKSTYSATAEKIAVGTMKNAEELQPQIPPEAPNEPSPSETSPSELPQAPTPDEEAASPEAENNEQPAQPTSQTPAEDPLDI